MKSSRHQKILEIITEHEVETQEDLLRLLKEEGFSATQATISRDIKELRHTKRPDANGRAKHVHTRSSATSVSVRYEQILRESIVDVDYAINMVVVKCHTGLANAACAAIDAFEHSGIVGTIAGDDTVFILMRSEKNAAEFTQNMKSMYQGR